MLLALCLCLLVMAALPAAAAPVPSVTNVNFDQLAGPRASIVTFNMLHGFGDRLNDESLDERLTLLARALEEDPPDVILLQEASVTRRHGNVVDRLRVMLNESLALRGISYNSASFMANGSSLIGFFEGSAILSRPRILSADSLVYRAQALIPPERRVALRAFLRTAGGSIAVIGTHLTNTQARGPGGLTRARQAEDLAAWIAGGGVSLSLLGGDFNDVPGSATIKAVLSAGGRDAWAEAEASAGAPGAGLTALNGTVRDPGDFPVERIDYVFLFGGGAVEKAVPFLDGALYDSSGKALWASDHAGVRVELSIP